MADDSQFASRPESKRKYEEPGASVVSAGAVTSSRRVSGFSSPPPDSHTAASTTPPSYNNVPPPPDGIQLAKQRAQEIAARLLIDAEAKRPRTENGGSGEDVGEKGPVLHRLVDVYITICFNVLQLKCLVSKFFFGF